MSWKNLPFPLKVKVPLELAVPISKRGPAQLETPKVTSPRRLTVVPLARPVRARVLPAVMVNDSMLKLTINLSHVLGTVEEINIYYLMVVQARLAGVTSLNVCDEFLLKSISAIGRIRLT